VLLLLAALVIWWFVYHVVIPTGPNPHFVPFWIAAYERPEIPPPVWLAADQRAWGSAQIFANIDRSENAGASPTLEVIQQRLEKLTARKADDAVVVYLAGYAIVDREGKIQILAKDSDPDNPRTQLPLRTLLDALKNNKCPARNRLLVLDLLRSVFDPGNTLVTAEGACDVLAEELHKESKANQLEDPGLIVIASCSPGQTAHASEALGRSVFGHFLQLALSSPAADANRDTIVSVRELASYLQNEVDGWAGRYRGLRQQPLLVFPEGRDFNLVVIKPQRSGGGLGGFWPFGGRKASAAATSKEGLQKADEKAKADGKDTKKAGEGESSEPGTPLYPEWLSAGWNKLNTWWTSGALEAAPRVVRRLAVTLVQLEERWRTGEQEEPLAQELASELAALDAAMDSALKLPHPPLRSVGQVQASGAPQDEALAAALEAVLKMRRDPRTVADDLKKAVAGFLKALAGKTNLDLAGAIVQAAADEPFDAATVIFLDEIAEQSKSVFDTSPGPHAVVELRFLKQLADRARVRSDDWNAETAKEAWDTLVVAERANNQPQALPWVRAQLDLADSSLHHAQVLLLPEARNFATWEQMKRAWDDAARDYELVSSRQRTISQGQRALARALATLTFLTPYLEALPERERERTWLEATGAALDLAARLEPPQPGDGSVEPPLNELGDATRRLDGLARTLLAPFRPEAVQELVRQCRAEGAAPDPGLALQIEALLLTPFLAAADRKALWDAERALEPRLARRPLSASADSSTAGSQARVERVSRRAARMAALLKLGGDATASQQLAQYLAILRRAARRETATSGDIEPRMSEARRAWSALAVCAKTARDAYAKLARAAQAQDPADRPGWLAPLHLAQWRSNPSRERRERDARATASWLAGHYRQQSRDLHDSSDRDGFFETAARECPTTEEQPEAYPELTLQSSDLNLSANRPAEIRLQLSLKGASASKAENVALSVLKTADERLRVPSIEPSSVVLAPDQPITAVVRAEWTDVGPGKTPPPSGLIVQAKLAPQRTYHMLLPLTIRSSDAIPKLVLSADPVARDEIPLDSFRLRALPGVRQAFYLSVRNKAPQPASVIVQVFSGERMIARSGEKPLDVPANDWRPVAMDPSFGEALPKAGERLRDLTGPLRLLLLDGASKNQLSEQVVPLGIAAPKDYLRVGAEFFPESAQQPNRLSVRVRPLPEMPGPPCHVELGLPVDKELFRTLRALPKEAKLVGDAERGSTLELHAERIPLDPDDDAVGSFYLDVDGVKRAIWLRCRFPQFGGAQRSTESDDPRVRFRAQPDVAPGRDALLRVAFEVDSPPPGAGLIFHVGHFEQGQFKDDITPWKAAARNQRIGFDAKGEKGALLFEAALEDQSAERPIRGLLGEHWLRAELTDANGTSLAEHKIPLVLDDQPPSDMEVTAAEPIDVSQGSLTVRLNVKPGSSGIKEVAFGLSGKADFEKPEAQAKMTPGKRVDPQGTTWEATLKIAKDASGKQKLTALARSGLGYTGFKELELMLPEAPAAQASAKPAAPKPGAIEGTLKEGDLTQRNVDVSLLDPDAAPTKNPLVDQKKTDARGAFSFQNLEPKKYRLYSEGSSRRKADKIVTVEPGKTATVELELLYR
jgi:hypothetical protein